MSWQSEVCIVTSKGERKLFLTGDGVEERLRDDHYDLVRLLNCSWVALLSDSPLGLIKGDKEVLRFVKKLNTSLIPTIKSYTELSQQLLRSVTVEAGALNKAFVPGMRNTPVFREYLHFLRTSDVRCFRFVYSFLVFASKLDIDDPELEATALRGWLEVEERLSKLSLQTRITDPLKVILEDLFSCWDESDFLPVHGPGAVAERGLRTVEEKCAFMAVPPGFQRFIDKHSDWRLPHHWHRSLPKSVSRLKFVRKSYKAYRSMCPEPCAVQYGQQGVRLWMETAISQALRDFVNLQNQTMNRSAAQWASITQLSDTIDLASASDSVAWELVRLIFPDKVLVNLDATRSTAVELPNGQIVDIHKFAPMGSSLCFPTQTVVYSAVVVLATIITYLGTGDAETIIEWLSVNSWRQLFKDQLTTRWPGLFQPFRCFGDDIITDNRVTSNVIDLLTLLGFKVNVDKSFIGDVSFRESCGGHYISGHDVTPFYFRVALWKGWGMSQKSYVSAIEAANRCLEFGYLHVRSVLINFLKRYPIEGIYGEVGFNPILFSEDPETSCAILTKHARNDHLVRRDKGSAGTAKFLQRDEVQSLGLSSRKESGVVSFDNYHYTAWCRSRYGTQPVDDGMGHLASSLGAAPKAGAVSTVWHWRWTPVS